jgi:thiol-disulfide isomerase/thioredoxin
MKKVIILILMLALSVGIVFVIVDSSSLDKPKYTNISLDDYKSKINNNEDFLIYVYKTSCPVCQEMKPYMNEVIESEELTILALNSEDDGNLERGFFENQRLEKSPTLIYYNNGVEENRLEGYHSVKELRKFVSKYKLKVVGVN